MKQKYIRLSEYNQVIIFPETIQHSMFSGWNPVSAGFCQIDNSMNVIHCWGESVSLGVKSHMEDRFWTTKQFFGIDAALELASGIPEQYKK